MKEKKNTRFYLALVIFSLVGQVAWVMENMYLNVFIYERFNADQNAISAMVAASAVAATVTTLLIGALSDKLGITHGSYPGSATFLRADVAVISQDALSTPKKNAKETILDTLPTPDNQRCLWQMDCVSAGHDQFAFREHAFVQGGGKFIGQSFKSHRKPTFLSNLPRRR